MAHVSKINGNGACGALYLARGEHMQSLGVGLDMEANLETEVSDDDKLECSAAQSRGKTPAEIAAGPTN